MAPSRGSVKRGRRRGKAESLEVEAEMLKN
jgi:hypothetical protein